MSRKLKIGYVLDDTLDTTDGIQQYILTVGQWMSERGHEVHYLVGETARDDIANVYSLAKNVKVKYNQNRVSIPLPSNKGRIDAVLNKLQLDVIHVQAPYSPLFAGRVIKAVSPSVRVVGTFHIVISTWLESLGARALYLMSGQTLKRFDAMISVSTAAQEYAKTIFGIDSVVIPNAVTIANFYHKPIYNNKLHIVFLGRLVERKGCEWLLKALVELKERDVPDFTVTIAGKGPLMPRLQKYARDNKLHNVTFSGFVKEQDKPALLASADIAVFPSTGGESFGIVLIEAMAAGSRVVIGGDNDGYRTVLGANESLIVDPKNSVVFANTLAHFLTNTTARQTAQKWMNATVQQYDTPVVGQKLLDVYLGV